VVFRGFIEKRLGIFLASFSGLPIFPESQDEFRKMKHIGTTIAKIKLSDATSPSIKLVN
jgi:hypothetical protein